MSDFREEEALGKLYDRRTARRLFRYLRPYKSWVVLATLLTLPIAPLAAVGPKLFQVAVDRYIVPAMRSELALDAAVRGIGWMSLLLGGLSRSGLFLPVHPDSRHAKGRAGNHVRPAQGNLLPSAAVAHELLRPQPGRPPGHPRHHRRRRAQRPVHHRRRRHGQRRLPAHPLRLHHAADELAPGAGHLRRAAADLPFHLDVPQSRARRQSPHPHRHCPHQRLPAGAHLRHERRAALQPRAQGPRPVRRAQSPAHGGLQGRHPGLCPLLSDRRIPRRRRHPHRVLVRRARRARGHGRHRRAHRLHAVRPALLPAHSGPQRKIQHPADRHDRRRAHLQAPR